MQSVVSVSLRDLFLAAGWTPERASLTVDAAPIEALYRELGGLTVGQNGTGFECATGDVVFESAPIKDYSVGEWEGLLRVDLFRLGISSGGHEAIFVSNDCRLFGFSEIHDAFYLYGLSVTEGLEHLFCGIRARPMLRPNQESVTLYGHCYRRDHPDVYHYAKKA